MTRGLLLAAMGLIIGLSGCSQQTDVEKPKQKYLFESAYINHAWGFTYYGHYVLTDGSVWCFDSSGDQPVYSDSHMTTATLGNQYKKAKLLGKVKLTDLFAIKTMIRGASKGKITRKFISMDGGSYVTRAFLYHPDTDTYQYVTLAASIGEEVSNSSQEAADLIKIFTKILKSYPLNEQCSDKIIIYK